MVEPFWGEKKKIEHIKLVYRAAHAREFLKILETQGRFLYHISVAHLHQKFFLHNKDSIPRIILLHLM